MISALLLAAGLSRRMGPANKLLLPWRGRTLIDHQAQTLLASNIDELIVVLGFQADLVKNALPSSGLKTCINEHYEKGMTSSIQAGVGMVHGSSQGILVCHGDQPGLRPDLINQLIATFRSSDDRAIVAPIYQGRRGNPVLFSSCWRNEILAETWPDGCRRVIQANSDALVGVPVSNPLNDIDTPEDYKNALDARRHI